MANFNSFCIWQICPNLVKNLLASSQFFGFPTAEINSIRKAECYLTTVLGPPNRTTSLIQSVPWAGHAVRTVSQPRVRPTSSCIYAVTNARMPSCCHACCRSRMAIPRDCEVPLDRLAGLTRYHAPTPQGWGSCRSGVFTPRERVYFTILVKLYI